MAVVALDLSEEELLSSARVYEVGRRRPADDESDAEEDEDEDSDGGSEVGGSWMGNWADLELVRFD